MTTRFGDTFYFLALLNRMDDAHDRAQAATREGGKLLTTQWVLTELPDAMAPAIKKSGFVALLQALRTDSSVEVVAATSDLFERGIALYGQRTDKDWSQNLGLIVHVAVPVSSGSSTISASASCCIRHRT